MAGRAAILQLLPLSLSETDRVSLLLGGYPEVLARPNARGLWFSSYVQTYLERDVRAVTSVRDLSTFRRFMALLASRHGQILNKTDLLDAVKPGGDQGSDGQVGIHVRSGDARLGAQVLAVADDAEPARSVVVAPGQSGRRPRGGGIVS